MVPENVDNSFNNPHSSVLELQEVSTSLPSTLVNQKKWDINFT